MKEKVFIILLLLSFVTLFNFCGDSTSSKDDIYINQILTVREDLDKFYETSPNSIFLKGSTKKFHPLEYYDVNPKFIFKSKFYKYPDGKSVKVLHTRGKNPKVDLYGYVLIKHNNKTYKLNVFKVKPINLNTHNNSLEIRFKDFTSGKTTCSAGRKLDFFIVPDTNFVYSIDFNLATNHYCAYDSLSSSPIALEEDSLGFAVEAGEKLFN